MVVRWCGDDGVVVVCECGDDGDVVMLWCGGVVVWYDVVVW